jgi:hypothetical protein
MTTAIEDEGTGTGLRGLADRLEEASGALAWSRTNTHFTLKATLPTHSPSHAPSNSPPNSPKEDQS